MIVDMKKITVVTQRKDATDTLRALRDIGVVHVEHEKRVTNQDINTLKDNIWLLDKALEVPGKKSRVSKPLDEKKWRDIAQKILYCVGRIEELTQEMNRRRGLIAQWEGWGDFNPGDFTELAGRGIYLKLCEVPQKALDRLPDGAVVERIATVGNSVRCVVITDEEKDIPFEVSSLPPMSMRELLRMQDENAQEIADLQNQIDETQCYKKHFGVLKEQYTGELRFREALAGMGAVDDLVYLRGFAPADAIEKLKASAQKEQWGLSISDPDENDAVPTLICNPRWVEIIRPVFGMMNILPGYHEVDISLFFLLFFSVFFGMLIGDAGYGLVFFGLTFFAHRKMREKQEMAAAFMLLYVLSSCAILWGLATGTFFGQAWLVGRVQPLLPWLRDNKNVQLLCFLIGATHLSIAHIWRGILKMPSIAVLSEIGWLSMLWGMFFVARMLILDIPLPGGIPFVFGLGVVLIVFFSKPNKNIMRAFGQGLGELLINLINTFTDIVSYVRLFAVGLATVAVADAFNAMASDVGFNSVVAGCITAFILILGHVLNITLGAMAILVHGIRLNVLEFSSHLNMEWTGIKYNPLRKKELSDGECSIDAV